MITENKKIVFLGDSITQGTGARAPENMYVEVAAREMGLREAKNYGIGGTRFALQKGTPERPKNDWVDVNSFCERFDGMDDDADAVVVFGGTNDFGHGDAPLGGFDDRTPDTFYGACHYLFTGLIKKYIGKPIVILTPMHRRSELKNTGDKKSFCTGTLKEYVDAIRRVAEYYSLPVLDLYAESGIQPAIPEVQEAFMPDGLHPNDAGHRLIAEKLVKFMRAL